MKLTKIKGDWFWHIPEPVNINAVKVWDEDNDKELSQEEFIEFYQAVKKEEAKKPKLKEEEIML